MLRIPLVPEGLTLRITLYSRIITIEAIQHAGGCLNLDIDILKIERLVGLLLTAQEYKENVEVLSSLEDCEVKFSRPWTYGSNNKYL